MNRKLAGLICPVVLVVGALALPAKASAKGTWTSSNMTQLNVNWQTDDGQNALSMKIAFPQEVSTATQGSGLPCDVGVSPAPGQGPDPKVIACPLRPPAGGNGASSGTVAATLKAPAACADRLEHIVTFDGFTDVAQGPITSANNCQPPPPSPPPPPPPGLDQTPAGGPVSAPIFPLVVGADAGAGPHVKVFSGASLSGLRSFFAFAPAFPGGVRVAVGDVNGDGRADVIAGAGAGAGPHVKVFSGRDGTLLHSFFAYASSFNGGVYVGAGDVNGDGRADVITGAGAGAPGGHVKVFDGRNGSELRSFLAFPGFAGGVRVAAGDVNGDGRADILTATGAGGGPHVKVFNGSTGGLLRNFAPFASSLTGGVFVAAGDVNGDGRADIITGAGAGTPGGHVKVFDGVTGSQVRSFFAFSGFAGGVRVAAGDVSGDGRADIVTGAGAGAPGGHAKVFDGVTGSQVRSFFAFPGFTGGVFVAGETFTGPVIRGGTVQLSRAGTVDLALSCPAGTQDSCTGNVAMLLPAIQKIREKAAKSSSANKPAKPKTFVAGTAKFRALPGKRVRVRLRISARGRRLIRSKRRISATARVTTRDGGKNKSVKSIGLTIKSAG